MILENAMRDGFVCFCGSRRIAEGTLAEVAASAWQVLQLDPVNTTLTFDQATGQVVDLNLSGSIQDVVKRYTAAPGSIAKRGRPKLGVVAREVTLLPRHWEWLALQPSGASAALRRLIDEARKTGTAEQSSHRCGAATYKFMSAIAGDLPLFEEAARALFARQYPQFERCIADWPPDIKAELLKFVAEDRSGL
ncbi:MAG: DUF2239 family protein [Aestuariivirga sp.]